MTLELLAISAGLELLEALNLTGTVYSDCQGLVKKSTTRSSFGEPPRVSDTLLSAPVYVASIGPRGPYNGNVATLNGRVGPILMGHLSCGPLCAGPSLAPSSGATPPNCGAYLLHVHL